MTHLNLILMIPFLSLFVACQDNANAPVADYFQYDQTTEDQIQQTTVHNQPLEMKPMVDPKTGRVMSYLPLPADWQIISNGSGLQGIQGPNGIYVQFMPAETYYFNIDPYIAQMTGKVVANPVPLQSIFRDRVTPTLQQKGSKLLKQYDLPEISRRSHQLLQQSLQRTNIQQYNVIASEWQQSNGYQSLVLLTQAVTQSQAGSFWYWNAVELTAPQQYFAQAKDAYLFAQANWQADQRTAMAHAADLNRIDREGQARIEQSWAAHNARMRSNQAAFEAQQRNHVNTTNEISDMSMRGYWSRSETEDRLRNKEVNAIHEEYTAVNPWDRKSMQIESGYNTYYMNSNGDIIGSNDANFNPNVHRDYNNTNWRKMPIRK